MRWKEAKVCARIEQKSAFEIWHQNLPMPLLFAEIMGGVVLVVLVWLALTN